MGIVNRTPDSFYAPARHGDVGSAVARATAMLAEGVDIVDIGGVRAGQEGDWVDEATEIDRVRPVLVALREAAPACSPRSTRGAPRSPMPARDSST
nr:dihydropteroate synthase [Tessaracoccus coleopterorum]